ncbi:hypothetical protein GKZ89_01710 [Bacillus mangrovi]|uniref:Dynamin N-terminal domain-containing protein n=1 Tax=Metabacillus mangrovi TaxID=1491830 RepID=A0A7X2S2K8_9BACI|nr:dynamin family protein [Metabacillus mangrovi]MTH52105.1 hypothetical protein [Metabacillus mangrovi]
MAVYQQETAIRPLIAVQSEMSRQGDVQSAAKLDDLILKAMNGEKQIAFTGHFSAGKSTMINTIMEEEILPSSPIPTSANLVYLKNGPSRIILETHFGEELEADPSMDLHELQQYCREGDEIARIHIWKPSKMIPDQVALIDTPGIDSNDASHMESTVSALHAADFIFYVTDYNHVQSEGTVEFIKRLLEDGQDTALIVNQIDKHQESELPFADFKERIEESFASIGLGGDRIYYTSMRDLLHPYNELSKVKNMVKEQLEKASAGSELVQAGLVVQEHLRYLANHAGLRLDDRTRVQEARDHLFSALTEMESSAELERLRISEAITALRAEISKVLENANITPFELRELARKYAEGKKPGFKAGLFSSKKKTADEIAKRRAELGKELKSLVSSQIDWHIKALFSKCVKAIGPARPELEEKLSAFETEGIALAADEALQETGAALTPEFVLNYTKSMSEFIKHRAKQQAKDLVAEIEEEIRITQDRDGTPSHADALRKELDETEERLLQYIRLEEAREYLMNVLSGKVKAEAKENTWKKMKRERKQAVAAPEKKAAAAVDGSIDRTEAAGESVNTEAVLKKAVAMSAAIAGIKGLDGRSRLIREKARRLEKRTFTIALFGAFSAGKSSAANALLGGKVLPSSPNPTTAAINRIVPVTDEHPHGTVLVKRKTVRQVEKELKEIWPEVNILSGGYKGLLEGVLGALETGKADARQQALLTVYAEGLGTAQENEDPVIQTGLDDFAPFVSEEKLAVLTEEAVIYYDCPLTRKGITLVDTPGADSLHKRHTHVAFEFIKKSDALLYVTYYNHPFSKGDREFIRQLGRVKDSFSLDKMFFLINAVDLAKDSAEAALVKQYIASQFLEEGVRKPRMYGISSLHELAGVPMAVPSEFGLFQQDLSSFIEKDLIRTAVSSLKDEMAGTVRQMADYAGEMNKSSEEKQAVLQRREKELDEADRYLKQEDREPFVSKVNQEIQEQFYYLLQRLSLQFSDLFKEHFHPGIFNQDGSAKQILSEQMNELLQAVDRRLIQELQAISLRSENAVRKQSEAIGERMALNLGSIMQLEGLTLPEFKELGTPHTDQIVSSTSGHFQKELNLFTGTKAFFEKNERAKMSMAIWEKLQKELENSLAEKQAMFASEYREALLASADGICSKFSRDAAAYVEGLKELYSDRQSADELQAALKQSYEWMEGL